MGKQPFGNFWNPNHCLHLTFCLVQPWDGDERFWRIRAILYVEAPNKYSLNREKINRIVGAASSTIRIAQASEMQEISLKKLMSVQCILFFVLWLWIQNLFYLAYHPNTRLIPYTNTNDNWRWTKDSIPHQIGDVFDCPHSPQSASQYVSVSKMYFHFSSVFFFDQEIKFYCFVRKPGKPKHTGGNHQFTSSCVSFTRHKS